VLLKIHFEFRDGYRLGKAMENEGVKGMESIAVT